MADYGFKVSLPGFDVTSATPAQCVIHSEYPTLKVLASGRQNYSLANGANTTYTFTHSVGIPCLPLVYWYNPVKSAYQMGAPYSYGSLTCTFNFDGTALYVTISNYTGASRSGHILWFVGYC